MTNGQHRLFNTVFSLALLGSFIFYALDTESRLEVCSDLLYEHLTNAPAPKGIHE